MIIELWPVLAAGISSVALGFIWYHPKVFGTAWMNMTGVSPEAAEKGKKRMPLMALFAAIAGVVIAYVMSYFSFAWGVYDWIGAVELGFWCWAGFVAPTSLGIVLWEGKSFKLYLINSLFWLVAFIVMALILLL
jgi:hypothetical protein